MIRTALVGVGAIAHYYLAALESSADLRLVVACDVDPERAVAVGEGIDIIASQEDLWRRDDVDAVIIALPNDLHYAACRDALRARMHVCCEKPIALSVRDADELTALAADRDRTLFTSFHRRYNRNVQRLARRLAVTSAPTSATVTYRERIEEHSDPDSWYLNPARGGDCVTDNGSNSVELLHHLFGPFRVLDAQVGRDGRGLIVEAKITLESKVGMPASIVLDWQYLHGEAKTVAVDVGTEVYQADMLEGFTKFKSSLYHEYDALLADFVTRIRQTDREPDSGADVARVIEAVFAMVEGTDTDATTPSAPTS